MMMPADVDREVAALRDIARIDNEVAGVGAEELRVAVLREIADANPHAVALASAALATVTEGIGERHATLARHPDEN